MTIAQIESADALEFDFAREPGGGKKVRTRIIGNKVEQLTVPRETLIWSCDLTKVRQVRFADTRVIATVARELVLSDASGPIFYVTQTVWANIGQISDDVRTYCAACAAVCRRLEALNPDVPTRLGHTGKMRWFGFAAGLACLSLAIYLLYPAVTDSSFWKDDFPALVDAFTHGSIEPKTQRLLALSFALIIGLPYVYSFGPRASRRSSISELARRLEKRAKL
jgi:hypothetical protein